MMIFEKHGNLKYKFGNKHFGATGYYVSTVGFNEVDGQEYPQGEPVDDGAANRPSSGNQKEEPDEHDIAPDEADGRSTYQVGEPIWED